MTVNRDCCQLWGEANLAKLSFVGGFDLLPLGIAACRQQLQDGILVCPYGDRKSLQALAHPHSVASHRLQNTDSWWLSWSSLSKPHDCSLKESSEDETQAYAPPSLRSWPTVVWAELKQQGLKSTMMPQACLWGVMWPCAYPSLSWPCAGPQRPPWDLSLGWASHCLCWPVRGAEQAEWGYFIDYSIFAGTAGSLTTASK